MGEKEKFAELMGFDSYEDLCFNSEIVYSEGEDSITWFLTELPSGDFAFWDDLEISKDRVIIFVSEQDAREEIADAIKATEV